MKSPGALISSDEAIREAHVKCVQLSELLEKSQKSVMALPGPDEETEAEIAQQGADQLRRVHEQLIDWEGVRHIAGETAGCDLDTQAQWKALAKERLSWQAATAWSLQEWATFYTEKVKPLHA